MLSAGNDKKAVKNDAKIADKFGRIKDYFVNNGLIASVII